jgi:acyl dehydratase
MTEVPAVYADDLTVGTVFPTGTYRLTREDLLGFASQWDPQPIHIDDDAAARGFYGEVIASGLHTFCIFQRLAVTHVYVNWEVIAGRAVRDVTFLKPVKAGAELTGRVTVTAIEPRDATRSLVYKFGELIDEAGDTVFTMVSEAYMRVRPSPLNSRVDSVRQSK